MGGGRRSLGRSSYPKLLLVVAVAAGVLLFSSAAQARGAFTPGGSCVPLEDGQLCLDKTASPNPVNVGQPLTFTIIATDTSTFPSRIHVQDTLPASVDFESASSPQGCPITPTPGTPDGTVNCLLHPPSMGRDIATITVIPTQCGIFTNTVTAGPTLTASTDFTVSCAGPNKKKPHSERQQPATPITQAPSQTFVSGTNTNNAGSVQTGGT